MDSSSIFNTALIKYRNESDLSVDLLLVVVGIFMATLIVIAPQIYIKNNIYYKSVHINKLYEKYQVLLAHNAQLKRQLQVIQFRHETLTNNKD